MPFIVTTKRPCPEGHTESLIQGDGGGWDGSYYHTPPCTVCDDRCEVIVSRRAIAVLEEAKRTAVNRIAKCAFDAGTTKGYQPLEDYAKTLTESGGTIGALPDGTVIDVKSVSWLQLAYDAGMRERVLAASHWLGGDPNKVLKPFPPHTEILDAFNAKQAAS